MIIVSCLKNGSSRGTRSAFHVTLKRSYRPQKFQLSYQGQPGVMITTKNCPSSTEDADSVKKLIEKGHLRLINAFKGDTVLTSTEYDNVLDAYSYSPFVHIPVNQLPLHEIDSFPLEILERMLTSALLCNYKGTALTLAREICHRQLDSSTKAFSFSQCILALFSNQQWKDICDYTDAEYLYRYFRSDMTPGLHFMQNPVHIQVLTAVLKSWIHSDAIQDIESFLVQLLLTGDTPVDMVLVEAPDIVYQLVVFLRHHGKYNLSHRLLSLLQHRSQSNIFLPNAPVNQRINSLINWSIW